MNRPPIIQELRDDPALCLVAINCFALIVAWVGIVAYALIGG